MAHLLLLRSKNRRPTHPRAHHKRGLPAVELTMRAVGLLLVLACWQLSSGLVAPPSLRTRGHQRASVGRLQMGADLDPHSISLYVSQLEILQHHGWADLAAQGLADAAVEAEKVCAGWGEPGWAPLCWLNGNPVFKAFDAYQSFIQTSIVTRSKSEVQRSTVSCSPISVS